MGELVSALDLHLQSPRTLGNVVPAQTDEPQNTKPSPFDSDGWRVLFVSVGALAGALLRWKITTAVASVDVKLTRYSTLAINSAGSLILGAVAALGSSIASPITLCVGVGFCGSFTTFSTYAVDTIKLLSAGAVGEAALLVVSTNIVCLSLAALSFFLTKNS